MKQDFSYHGYRIRFNHLNGFIWIESFGGGYIGSAKDENEARHIIDTFLVEDSKPQRIR